MDSLGLKLLQNLVSLLVAVFILVACFALSGQTKPSTSFAVLTLALPSLEIPLPIQLVLANYWQLQLSEKAYGYPWWDFGCFGVTFLIEPENLEELREAILRLWKQANYNLVSVRRARALASQQLKQWKREPMEWLRWNARVVMLGRRQELDDDEPYQVGLEEIQRFTKSLARYDPPLISREENFWSIPTITSVRAPLRSSFYLTFNLASRRAHGLWWLVTKGEPEASLILGELLGSGTGAKWFQVLRVENPIAYHAIAQVQWTPIGAEISLYASTLPKDFKLARQNVKKLLSELSSGRISNSDFERAKQLAQLHLKQLEADPIASSRLMAVWAMSGRTMREWENLPAKLQSLTLSDLKTFCHSLPPFSELTAVP